MYTENISFYSYLKVCVVRDWLHQHGSYINLFLFWCGQTGNAEILGLIYAIFSHTDQCPALQTSSPNSVRLALKVLCSLYSGRSCDKDWKSIFRAAWGIITEAGCWSFCQTISECRANPLLQIVESKQAESYFEMAHCLFSSSEAQ